MQLKSLKIGDKIARLPIIQGGMGVGVSRSSLAGAVAAAGGHLGFHPEKLEEYGYMGDLDAAGEAAAHSLEHDEVDSEIRGVVEVKKEYEQKYGCHIPVIMAGGIFDHADVEHAFLLGAEGVQVASRFVATYECDASDAFKQAYLDAKDGDAVIIQSPVGLPGRAVHNAFVDKTKALVDSVKGDTENGLVFCGANVGRINRLMHVSDLMKELAGEA